MTVGGNTPYGPGGQLPPSGQQSPAGFPAAGGPPPGWYPDPGGSGMQRYFDGANWTDRLAPAQAPPPAPQPQPVTPPPPPPAPAPPPAPVPVAGPPPPPPLSPPPAPPAAGPVYPGAPGPSLPPPGQIPPAGYPGASEWPTPAPAAPKRGIAVVAALASAVVLAGAGMLAYKHFQRPHSADGMCPVEGASAITLEKKADSEPTITVPAAKGWKLMKPSDLPGAAKKFDSPVIRGFIISKDLQENGFTPNAVVTLEKFTDNSTPEEIVDREVGPLKEDGKVSGPTTDLVCSNTVYRADFTDLASSPDGGKQTGMELISITNGTGGDRWVATVTLQTRNPDNPGFTAQRDALLKGFHVAPAQPPQ